MSELTGKAFTELIQSGFVRLKDKSAVVNSLNIFPVPDGDTGTNMMLSLGSGTEAMVRQCQIDSRLGQVAESLATGLMMGARGNSGVILSQLFRGFQKVVLGKTELDVPLFAQALNEGVQIAYRAVAKPVEGTILTVAREAAAAGLKEAKRTTNLATWMEHVLQAADAALQKTPEQLQVLKQAGVVDSGGQGLVYIYEGFVRFLHGDPVLDANEPVGDSTAPMAFAAMGEHHDGEFGYCTEVLIRVENQIERAHDSLRDVLQRYGDSLLVVSNADLIKVHVHTLHPGRVLEDALSYGPLVKIKIDNMTEQNQELQHTPELSLPQEPVETPPVEVAVVAVAAGEGLSELFQSLGVDVIVTGGQTMNPSTEEIVKAVRQTNAASCIFLPNNNNIVLAAQQAQTILGDQLTVIPTTSIPAGIAAMMAYLPSKSVEENAQRMGEAVAQVQSGLVVRAVRDSVFQDREIQAGQFLGMIDHELVTVADDRFNAAALVLTRMKTDSSEIVTMFFGADATDEDVERVRAFIEDELGLEVEAQFGGQPIYDYIFSME